MVRQLRTWSGCVSRRTPSISNTIAESTGNAYKPTSEARPTLLSRRIVFRRANIKQEVWNPVREHSSHQPWQDIKAQIRRREVRKRLDESGSADKEARKCET